MENDVREREALATMISARIKELPQELAKVNSKFVASRLKCANSRWDVRGAAKNASKVMEAVSNTLMTVSAETTIAT